MKLLYIWVEDYRCFKNQGFNFSSKQKFEYDKDNKIQDYVIYLIKELAKISEVYFMGNGNFQPGRAGASQ